jgi:lipoyl synthase
VGRPKIRLSNSRERDATIELLAAQKMVTVCQQANCPNIHQCFSQKCATFMLLGDTCTRHCRFCAVKTGNPMGAIDNQEPQRVAQSVAQMGLEYVVLTSVDRDDLLDLGAGQFSATIHAIKQINSEVLVEVLTPDFMGRNDLVAQILAAGPIVFAHNIETVKRLTSQVRDPRGSYQASLNLLAEVHRQSASTLTKTSLMLGMGEQEHEVQQTLDDLLQASCQMVTFGQYLAPSSRHYPVHHYLEQEQFGYWEQQALSMGFKFVAAGPLVRSSYRAGELFVKGRLK